MNPHSPHPDENRSSADRQRTDPTDPDLPDTGQPGPSQPNAGSSDATQPAGSPAGGAASPEPPRLYQPGDPSAPYAPPNYGQGPYQDEPAQGMPGPHEHVHQAAPPQNFFDWIRRQGINRGRDRWIGGVASGIAHRLGVDPLIIRGILIVLTIFAGIGVLAYGLAWALLPEPDGRIHVQEAARGRWTAGMTGALITTVLGLPSLGTGVWGWDRFGLGAFIWTVFWVGGAIALVYYLTQRNKAGNGAAPMSPRYEFGSPAGTAPFAGTASADAQQSTGQRSPSGVGPAWGSPSGATPPDGPHDGHGDYNPSDYRSGDYGPGGYGAGGYGPGGYGAGATPPPPAAPRNPGPGTPAVAVTVGSALLVGGGIKALDAANVIDLGDSGNALVWAVGAAIVGLGILLSGLRGRTSGILGFFAVVALLVSAVFSVVPHGDRFRFQDADWTPASIEQASGGFEITGGAGTVDLTKLALKPPLGSDVVVPIDATASNLTVIIPATVPVQVQADMTMGNLHDGNQDRGGITKQQSDYNTSKPGARLVLQISGTVSNVTIQEGN
ncbi:PspC domain-containing protein [Arthrobacter sp. ov118]|uniref:PspC domain-containing protein n=1 Tax=Arthrobacter sp. ov118 TaxID=1761747 RepID=UPI0008F43BB9|nr:PspC domain-containing protein [Arthrobacter sp. ov118]SFT43492.1 phage shock protein C (PspC) family protein [Arthrobacter sp. ov118]